MLYFVLSAEKYRIVWKGHFMITHPLTDFWIVSAFALLQNIGLSIHVQVFRVDT